MVRGAYGATRLQLTRTRCRGCHRRRRRTPAFLRRRTPAYGPRGADAHGRLLVAWEGRGGQRQQPLCLLGEGLPDGRRGTVATRAQLRVLVQRLVDGRQVGVDHRRPRNRHRRSHVGRRGDEPRCVDAARRSRGLVAAAAGCTGAVEGVGQAMLPRASPRTVVEVREGRAEGAANQVGGEVTPREARVLRSVAGPPEPWVLVVVDVWGP